MSWIKKFDPDGNLLLTFSRSGEGPGELSQPFEMAMTPDGDLVVFELGNQRFSFFDADGEYLRTHKFQGVAHHVECAPDGSIYVLAETWSAPDPERGTLSKITRFSPDMSRSTDIDSAFVTRFQMIGTGSTVSSPYPTRIVFALTPSGNVIVGHAGSYLLKVYSADGELLQEIRHDAERMRISKEDREEYYKSFSNTGVEFEKQLRRHVKFPSEKPYFYDVFVDHEGYILVETYDVVDGEPLHDVFTSDGDFVGQVRLPDLKRVLFNGGYTYRIVPLGDEPPGVGRFKPVVDGTPADDTP
jgi:hypothetical protein